MTLSVLMPVHGKVPYLNQAIQSVANQDHQDWELLIVLDRPTKELWEFSESQAKKDSRIRLLISPGTGIVDALNFGLSQADGPLVARIDSDDCMKPSRLRIQEELLIKHPDIACVGSQMTLIDESGNRVGQTSYPTKFSEIKKTLSIQNCIGHPSVMYQKIIVQEVGGYRKLFTGCEDYDLWLRLSKNHKICNLEEQLTNYRVSDFQYSRTFGTRHTLLEDASRLDALFPLSFSKYNDLLSDDQLSLKVAEIRRRNLIAYPCRVRESYKGLIVSRMLRIAASNSSKSIKISKLLYWSILLFLVSPSSMQSLIAKKLFSERMNMHE